MGSEENAEIGEILEKVDSLSEELASIRKDLDTLSSIPEIVEKIEAIGSEIDEVKSSLEPIAKIDDIESSLDEIKTSIEEANESKNIEELAEKIDGLVSSLNEISESKENEVIIKKIDDILIGLPENDVVSKKLDDLQGYIAGLSGIEERVEDLSSAFQETQEIVGIIVRQLDDIERKYNLSIDKINEAVDLISKLAEQGLTPQSKTLEKKITKNTEGDSISEPEKKAPISKANLPSTIDALMGRLIDLVNPQTEATEMAEALEEVRDQLTTMIQGTTPVLFQFGKKARELKSYPPTATLNENDIASLNKDIKSWAGKLKDIAKNS